MNLKTNLLGKTVSISGAPELYQIVAVWLASSDAQPSVTLMPLDKFGRPTVGVTFRTERLGLNLIAQ